MTYLNVNEIFGPTVQGEGRNAGQCASFIRLAGCNLSCSWCDTPYTWDWSRHNYASETHRMDVDTVVDRVWSLPGRLTVSGGEPLLQTRALAELLDALPHRTWDVETNGTRPLGPTAGKWDTVVCSPKVGPSAEQGAKGWTIDPSILEVADFKFVIQSLADWQATVDFVEQHEVEPFRVWLMPEGTTPDIVMERTHAVAQLATAGHFNVSTRLHVLVWGDERAH